MPKTHPYRLVFPQPLGPSKPKISPEYKSILIFFNICFPSNYLLSPLNCKIGLLSTEATLKTNVYSRYFSNNYKLVSPGKSLQKKSVNKAIKYVKMGKVKEAEKILRPAVNYLIKTKCKKIILGCTELPIAIFAYKSFKKIKQSRIFIDPNLLLANISMKKYKRS